MDESQTRLKPNPIKNANPISRLFFWWLNPLFVTGYKRSLNVEDMYEVTQEDSSKYLSEKLEREWQKEKEKLKKGKKPSLLLAMIRSFGALYMSFGIFVFLEEGVKVVQPLLLGGLIRYFDHTSNVSRQEAYLYAGGVSFCALFLAIIHHPYFYYVMKTGMWLRISACSLIYKKAMQLSNKSMNKVTTGHIVNLMSNDVNRFDQATLFLHFLWVGPLQAFAVLAILWHKMGPASLAGFAVLVLLIPIQSFMGKLFTKLRAKTAKLTDERVRIMNEILTGMRVIKMYCWEKMFGELIHTVREKEMKRVRMGSHARAFILAPFFISAKLIAYTTFLAFVLICGPLSSELVFVAIALYNPVRLVMSLFVPVAITYSAESRVTIRRLQDFLLLEELEEASSIVRSPANKPSDAKITALNVTGYWDEEQGNVLSNISFEVRPGELLAVIGPVGCGKSSLLMALLGEMTLKETSSVKLTGKVAYAAQQPWVFSASVRQNIIFGQPFDMERYQRCIKAAALSRDLEIMPNRDQTLVGERGVSLSGGQKARISLARALYYQADIYLLDDPLSAVDTAVGRHIFDKCVCGVLKDKPRILVTHQLQYLQSADRILILKDGAMHSVGTFEELARGGVDFAALLKRPEEEDTGDDSVIAAGCKSSTANPEIEVLLEKLDSERQLSKSWDHRLAPSYLAERDEDGQEPLLSKSVAKGHKFMQSSMHDLHKAVVSRSISRVSRQISHTSDGSKSVGDLPTTLGGSLMSLGSLDPDIKADFVAPVQEEEKRAAGTVSASLYLKYFHSGGNVLWLVILVLFNLAAQTVYILSDWWLSYWSSAEEQQTLLERKHNTLLDQGYNQTNVTVPEVDRDMMLWIYTGITVGVFFFGILRAVITFHVLVNAAKKLHKKMFASIIRVPVLFFDNNPVGRILNRFSKDMGQIDEILPLTMFDFIQCALVILGIVIVVGVINPWVFIPTVPLCVVFIFLRKYFLQTSRDVKRLEGTTRSPVFSHLSASLQGLWTIRAFSATDQFQREFDKHQDLHTAAWFLFLSSTRWFAIRLDVLCAIFVCAVTFCSVFASAALSAGLVGLTVTYAISLMGLFQWGVRQSAEVENQMTSVERVMEYSQLEPEAPLNSDPDHKPPPSWPASGKILADQANFRYSDNTPVVLKNISFCINPKEKVGIVGRTGAGKSSLISMLFRLAEPTGTLRIDDRNILQMGLHDVRKKISIIPQDPVLFTGTVRRNLDPFSQHTDLEVWKALEEVQLKAAVQDLPTQLDHQISEGGSNFSVGQRQLVCLARAILRRNQILVIDEATANVDPRTDGLIQETIREKFKQCTVLTIAHRLNTIMDSDRVMVLQDGSIKEFAAPYKLLQAKTGLLYQMVEQTGRAESSHLMDIAYHTYLTRQPIEEELPSTDQSDKYLEENKSVLNGEKEPEIGEKESLLKSTPENVEKESTAEEPNGQAHPVV